MSRILYIIRHAQALNGLNQLDSMRALTAIGKEQANNLGKLFKSHQIFLDVILSSPAVRAKETALEIAAHLLNDHTSVKIFDVIYSGSCLEILAIVNGLDVRVQRALIVGHWPTIMELYSYLTKSDPIIAMNTAELRSLSFDVSWAEVTENSGTPMSL